MASGSKSDSVFTGNPMGGSIGQTPMQKKAKGGGGTIVSPYPMDNVHGVDLPDTMGGPIGGSVTNLAHSLKGASAVQDRSSKGGKTENSGI